MVQELNPFLDIERNLFTIDYQHFCRNYGQIYRETRNINNLIYVSKN